MTSNKLSYSASAGVSPHMSSYKRGVNKRLTVEFIQFIFDVDTSFCFVSL